MLAAVSTYAMVVRRQTPPPSRATVRTLAVFPFTVRGNSELSYLREGMVDLLSAKMNGTSQFRAIDPRGIIAAARQTQSSGPDIQQIASIGVATPGLMDIPAGIIHKGLGPHPRRDSE